MALSDFFKWHLVSETKPVGSARIRLSSRNTAGVIWPSKKFVLLTLYAFEYLWITRTKKPCSSKPGTYRGDVNVAWTTLETVVNFMYTGMCDFKQDTVIDIIQAAAEFGMERLRSKVKST